MKSRRAEVLLTFPPEQAVVHERTCVACKWCLMFDGQVVLKKAGGAVVQEKRIKKGIDGSILYNLARQLNRHCRNRHSSVYSGPVQTNASAPSIYALLLGLVMTMASMSSLSFLSCSISLMMGLRYG